MASQHEENASLAHPDRRKKHKNWESDLKILIDALETKKLNPESVVSEMVVQEIFVRDEGSAPMQQGRFLMKLIPNVMQEGPPRKWSMREWEDRPGGYQMRRLSGKHQGVSFEARQIRLSSGLTQYVAIGIDSSNEEHVETVREDGFNTRVEHVFNQRSPGIGNSASCCEITAATIDKLVDQKVGVCVDSEKFQFTHVEKWTEDFPHLVLDGNVLDMAQLHCLQVQGIKVMLNRIDVLEKRIAKMELDMMNGGIFLS